MIDYICVVHKNHTSSFDAPQAVPPQCCGQPMAPAQPAAAQAKTPVPQQPKNGTRGRKR